MTSITIYSAISYCWIILIDKSGGRGVAAMVCNSSSSSSTAGSFEDRYEAHGHGDTHDPHEPGEQQIYKGEGDRERG
jgi:hypothetical protein